MEKYKPNNYEPDYSKLVALFQEYQLTPSEAVIREFDVLADKGSMQSLIYIGVAYRDGHGVQKNLQLAESYFLRAFKAKNDVAGYYLGKLYMEQKRYQEAFEVLNKSAKYEFAPTLSCLGRLYMEGCGVKKDVIRAKELLEKASKLGNIWASRDLASLYISGEFGLFRKSYGFYLMWNSILRGAIINTKDASDQSVLG